jgi:Gpi18-like mannosyltransferase
MTSIAAPITLDRDRISTRSTLGRIVGMAVAIRLVLWAVGLAVTGYLAAPFGPALFVWSRWDAPHYLDIARYGYAAHGQDALWIAFFPLYPFLVRLVSVVFSDLILSGLIVSFFAAIGCAYVLTRLVELEGTTDEANHAAILLFAFPTAYFLAAPYTEGIFLFSVLAAIYAARTKHWVGAGLFAAMATASRLVGLAVLPALAVEALWPLTNAKEQMKRLAALSVGITGFITYLAINARAYGDPLHFLVAERGRPWYQHAVWPWNPIFQAWSQFVYPRWTGTWFWFVYPARMGAFIIAVGVMIWGAKRLRAADHVYAWTALGLSMMESRLISLPRYLLALYPIPIVLAYKLKDRRAFVTVVVVCFALQAYLFSRYALALWAF